MIEIMAFPRHLAVFILQLILLPIAFQHCNAKGLKLGYYKKTCPGAEATVKQIMTGVMSRAPTLAAPLLRMHFHDCFVRVC